MLILRACKPHVDRPYLRTTYVIKWPLKVVFYYFKCSPGLLIVTIFEIEIGPNHFILKIIASNPLNVLYYFKAHITLFLLQATSDKAIHQLFTIM